MLNHIVLFRRKPSLARDSELESRLVQRMDALGNGIEVVRRWKLSANELDRPICWDYVLESTFDNVDALNSYLYHPLHQALVTDLKSYFEWAAADYTDSSS